MEAKILARLPLTLEEPTCQTISRRPSLTGNASTSTKTMSCATWSKKFGVSHDQLKAAVRRVGVMADDVARELGKSSLRSIVPPDDTA